MNSSDVTSRTIPREVRLEIGMSQTKLANQIKLLQLTPIEKEVIIACLLGDGTLSKSGMNYRLRIEHNFKHKEYVEWKYNLLKRRQDNGFVPTEEWLAEVDKEWKEQGYSMFVFDPQEKSHEQA